DRLHRLLDLRLGRLARHLKDQRVLVFLNGETLFGDDRTSNYLICRVHLCHLRRSLPPRTLTRSRFLLCAFRFGCLALALRNRVLQRQLQLLNCRLAENGAVVTQQVIGMNFVSAHQLYSVEIAGAQFKVLVPVPVVDQERGAVHLQSIQGFAELLGLGLFHVECVHDDQLAIRKLGGQSRAQRAQDLLARKRVFVGAGLRSMYGAAMAPQRRTDRAYASSAGALLFPELLAGARDQLLVLGRMCTGTLGGAIMLHRLPEKVFIDGAENLVRKIEGADLGSAQVI